MRSGVLTSARLMVEELQRGGSRYRAAFLGVTYRPGVVASPLHITGLQKNMREWLARRGHVLRDVWVAELQERGAVHYHLMVFLPRGLTLPKPDKQGWWPHGSTRIEWAKKPVGYLAKYASKGGDLHDLPAGTRLWGYAGLRGTARDELRWWLAPSWLRELVECGDVLRRVGRWWENRTLGIRYRSPYEILDLYGGHLTFVGPHWTPEHVEFF
jgi:hypothetical protein